MVKASGRSPFYSHTCAYAQTDKQHQFPEDAGQSQNFWQLQQFQSPACTYLQKFRTSPGARASGQFDAQ
eukprot:scaffold61942_cov26-Tisochrysis_lutea.AAC.1